MYVVAEDCPSVAHTDAAGRGLPYILIFIHLPILKAAASILCTERGGSGGGPEQGASGAREKEREVAVNLT